MGCGDLAIFNHIGFRGRKNELAGGDIHLPATKMRRINAAFDATDHIRQVQHRLQA